MNPPCVSYRWDRGRAATAADTVAVAAAAIAVAAVGATVALVLFR
jgi:hypothetical protein